MKNVKCKVAELGDSRKELDPKSGKGYGYFKTIGNICGDFAADFDYGGGVVMRAFIANGSEGRESFALEGSKVFRHYDRKVSEKPCPTLLVRQNGEAWRRFVSYRSRGNDKFHRLRTKILQVSIASAACAVMDVLH